MALFAALLTSCSVSRHTANIDYPQLDSRYRYEGILEQQIHKCSVTGPKERRMYVYLPKEYYNTNKSYPVLYLLHGARGNELSWIVKGEVLQIIDSLANRGLMEPSIVVLPNTNQYNDDCDYSKSREKGAFESFFENNGMVESSFVNDVVHTIDSLYRTKPEKRYRAIAGLSIGALQSIHISASYPDVFGYVGLFSAMVKPFVKHSEHSSFYRRLKQRHKQQFALPPELYWVMIGKSDFFYLRMKHYCNYLERNGYKHEHYFSKGGHQWHNWKLYCDKFMQRLWK